MYAIVKTGGKQYRVAPGDILKIEKLEGFKNELEETKSELEEAKTNNSKDKDKFEKQIINYVRKNKTNH